MILDISERDCGVINRCMMVAAAAIAAAFVVMKR